MTDSDSSRFCGSFLALVAMLTLASLDDLLLGRRTVVVAGHVRPLVASMIRSSTIEVYLSKDSLRHILLDHDDIGPAQVLLIPNAIHKGLTIHEKVRPNCATISYLGPEGIRYALAIKATRNGGAIFISAFHRMKQRQTRSLLTRGVQLQPHM